MLIVGQFYGDELTPVRVTKRSIFKIDKVLDKRYRNGIPEYLFRWRVYRKVSDLWVPADSVKISQNEWVVTYTSLCSVIPLRRPIRIIRFPYLRCNWLVR